jgi:hypothetical protein
MGRGGAMDLICMCPSHIPDPVFLLWKEDGGKNEIDVMPSKVIGLSQVLELFNIRICVSGEKAKVLFYLREVSKGKGDMDPHSAFCSGHFLERVDGNWLTRGSMRVSVEGLMGSCSAGGADRGAEGEAEGGAEGWAEGQAEGGAEERQKEGQKGLEQGPMVEQWKPVADKVEAH